MMLCLRLWSGLMLPRCWRCWGVARRLRWLLCRRLATVVDRADCRSSRSTRLLCRLSFAIRITPPLSISHTCLPRPRNRSEITFAVRGNTDADFYSVRVQRGAADDVRRAFLDISRGDLEKGSLRPTPSAPAPHVIASPDSGAGARAINNGDDDDDEPAVTPIYPDA